MTAVQQSRATCCIHRNTKRVEVSPGFPQRNPGRQLRFCLSLAVSDLNFPTRMPLDLLIPYQKKNEQIHKFGVDANTGEIVEDFVESPVDET